MSGLTVDEVGPDEADDVVAVIHRAFRARPLLDPPSTATDETRESVAEALGATGGLLARGDGAPVGAMLFDMSSPGRLGLRRVGVDPTGQLHGVASAMVGVAEDVAERRGLDGVWLKARVELPDTVEFWRRRGYSTELSEGPNLILGKALPVTRALPTEADAREFGRRLAGLLAGGDLIVLSGALGAGKTTLTQGIGAGLGVRGAVTSPTFVIARVHPSEGRGPALVHADAYRLGGVAELDDLDLDASLDASVTVVEWGEGVAEGLADDRLEVRLDRLRGGDASGADDTRVVSVRPHGARWSAVPLRSTLLT
ncbi:MAG TPA: tRNA (adenosine(37)-N6)-threonylcarbamoyltransferase complex ATPase subunit type 1 TsaE [Nocardioidaceae bacterium]|nr:tRNA (adenosine(37)-N6)-threonylcarbamoyltransferase complex ATPase subunit type 1 TsaE [Nocardioidaceae bacterium]